MISHDKHMRRCLELATKGWPAVQPNPMVGSVIVKGNKIVAEGYHEKFGGSHAEVNAINNLPKDVDPKECILYVSLEPCRHHGKTPPCADLIIKKGFKTVVVACTDPNPLVSGSGVRKLLEAGIEVITNVLEHEARQQNRRFITFFEKKRPYVILKWARSADGFISRTPVPAERENNLITGKEAQTMVHGLRAECMAVFVGKNTVLLDDPELTTRLVKGKNPIRVFVDKDLKVPRSFRVYDGKAPVIVFNNIRDAVEDGATFIKVNFNGNIIEQVLHKLHQHNIQTVLVEGGAALLTDFIAQQLHDEVFILENPNLRFGNGLKGPEFPLPNSFDLVGNDKLYHAVHEHVLARKHA
jgi:diaminohydroxyphosphoribosylaminopyrimidine deaminase/5-amino-6-(5-phosphoribosylamino)uracil reductase